MKKQEHKKRRASRAQQAARSPRAHKAARGLPRTDLRGLPRSGFRPDRVHRDTGLLKPETGLRGGRSTELRASRAKGERRPVPTARRSVRAPSPSEPSCSEAEAPTARPAGGADEIGTDREAPSGSAPREEIGSAATVSVAAAAQLLSISRRTVQYMLKNGRLLGWRLPPRGWWKVSRESLARLSGRVSPQQTDTLQAGETR